MAEAALTLIAKSTINLLTSIEKEDRFLPRKSRIEIKKLALTIDTISSYLHDAEERRYNDHAVQRWLSRLRDIFYSAEDLYDLLAAKALRKRTIVGNKFTKEVRLFFSKSNQLSFMFKVTHQVKSAKESLDDIMSEIKFLGLGRNLQHVDESFRRSNSYTFCAVNPSYFMRDVIGRDQDRDRIIDVLLSEDKGDTSTSHAQTLSVVALIGFGGIGKTALAQLVYNDNRVQQGFEMTIWTCIRDFSNINHVLKDIILSADSPHYVHLDFDEFQMLQSKLREIIGGRKFLIVMDDVFEITFTDWKNLESILSFGKSGSKVLVTTRYREVAKCLAAFCFDLEVLSDESAWSLFVKMAFRDQEERSKHPTLEAIGKEIVSRCGNVPLAVISIGSLLFCKEKETEAWLDLLHNKHRGILLTSVGASEVVIEVLMISYHHLPSIVKPCFAYCSLFPKDYEFDKDELVHLWISQGFIRLSNYDGQSLEELGEALFFQLVDRSFFQDVKSYKRFAYDGYSAYHDPCGFTAKMHGLMHDLAIKVAETESIFLDNFSLNEGKRKNLRHISIDFEVDDSVDYCSMPSDPQTMRSLLFPCRTELSKSSLNMGIERFRMLRTLYLSNLGIDNSQMV